MTRMPNRFHYPQDANAQVVKAIEYYTEKFGQAPAGMWPGEGSVAQEIIPIFGRNGIRWIATDEKILAHSKPPINRNFFHTASMRTGKRTIRSLSFSATLNCRIRSVSPIRIFAEKTPPMIS